MINYQKVIIFTQILFICWDYVAYLLGLKISMKEYNWDLNNWDLNNPRNTKIIVNEFLFQL